MVRRPFLTERHVKTRLEWANEHHEWTVDDWKRVLWSDEAAVKKDSDVRQFWAFRHQNKLEKYAPKNVRGRSKSGDVQQMIWACFTSNKLGPIVFINGTLNSSVYIDILRQNLLPF